jgi:hypothetical protein
MIVKKYSKLKLLIIGQGELKRKYEKMFEEKNAIQDKVRLFETSLLKQQNEKRLLEEKLNSIQP